MSDRPFSAPTGARRPRVFLIDADADLVVLVEQWLRPAGLEVLAVPRAAGAAAADLVIADLPYPSRARVDALRADLGLPAAVPVLVLSSAVFGSVDCCGPAARALGADALLPKPLSGDALRRAVAQLVAT